MVGRGAARSSGPRSDRVALSLFTVAFVGLYFSPWSAAASAMFIAGLLLWSGWRAYRGSLRLSMVGLPMVLLPALALMSTLWSQDAGATAWGAAELAFTIVFGVLIPRNVSLRFMMAVLYTCGLVLAIARIPSLVDSIRTGLPFSYIFGSKNMNAINAEVWVISCIFFILDRQLSPILKVPFWASALYAILIIFATRSAGAYVATFVFFAVASSLVIYGRLSRALKPMIGALSIPVIGAAVVALPALTEAWESIQTGVLKKDATLTGRTRLWAIASDISHDHPWLGTGYNAFWRQGNLVAEGIWREFYIPTRMGFNFHNVIVELEVELGKLGFFLMIGLYVYVLLKALEKAVLRPSNERVILFSMLISTYLYSFSEFIIGSAFSLLTMIWAAIPGLVSLEGPRAGVAGGGGSRGRQVRTGTAGQQAPLRAGVGDSH